MKSENPDDKHVITVNLKEGRQSLPSKAWGTCWPQLKQNLAPAAGGYRRADFSNAAWNACHWLHDCPLRHSSAHLWRLLYDIRDSNGGCLTNLWQNITYCINQGTCEERATFFPWSLLLLPRYLLYTADSDTTMLQKTRATRSKCFLCTDTAQQSGKSWKLGPDRPRGPRGPSPSP